MFSGRRIYVLGLLHIATRLVQQLGGLPDALPEERDARASIALALEELQSGDLAFHRAI
jgi:hypothetical protein